MSEIGKLETKVPALYAVKEYVLAHKGVLLHILGYVAVYVAGAHHLLKALLKAVVTHVK